MLRGMERRQWIVLYRVGFGLLTVATVGFLFYHNNRKTPDFSASNFFSFFTIESNLFAAAVLLYGAARPANERASSTYDLVRGAAVLYMTTTGVVYGVLLAGYAAELGTAVRWADNVVHRLMPVILVVDWLIDPPRTRLTMRRALVWLVYPLAYLAYSLVRGPIVDWYPYPFLDPDKAGGYVGVFAYSVGITVFVLLVAWGTVAVGNREGGRHPAAIDGRTEVSRSA